jgi:hypothetical protein
MAEQTQAVHLQGPAGYPAAGGNPPDSTQFVPRLFPFYIKAHQAISISYALTI